MIGECETRRTSARRNRSVQRKRSRLVRLLVVPCGIAVLVAGCDRSVKQQSPATGSSPNARVEAAPPVRSRKDIIEAVEQSRQSGDIANAERLLSELVLSNPQDFEAIFNLGQLRAATGDPQAAIDLFSEIPAEATETGIAALGFAAQLCTELQQYDQAKQRYQKILELVPQFNEARRQLAYLSNRQGRRHQAVMLVRELCASGDITQDELHSMIAEADAMFDPIVGDETVADSDASDRSYYPIGPLATARFEFTNHRYAEAAAIVRPLIQSGQADDDVLAFYGRAVAEAQDDRSFSQWLTLIGDGTRDLPDFWAAIGVKLMTETRYDEGLAALAEAVVRDPTDIRSTRRIVQAFRVMKNDELEKQWTDRYEKLSRSVTLSGQVADGRFDSIDELADVLRSLDRNLEAVMWRAIAAVRPGGDPDAIHALNKERLSFIEQGNGFPTREMILSGWPATFLDPIEPDSILLEGPTSESPASTTYEKTSLPTRDFQPAVARFREVSRAIGLDHRYRIATETRQRGFAIYQQNGGGVAVIDYDLDGIDDLYLAQGAADAPVFVANTSDQLFRFIPTDGNDPERVDVRCHDQTSEAGLLEARYTLGVTCGDWNQDGFPDLAVANIGPEVLMINQGDGTFRSESVDTRDDLTILSTSIAIADLSGDGLPDLYVANYLRDPNIAMLPKLDPQGLPIAPMTPHDFRAALDSVALNDGSGGFRITDVGEIGSDESYGLGLMVNDFSPANPGNEVFVANDARPNQLWSYSKTSHQWEDSAVARGCAFGGMGSATASMGIAAADFDRSGSLDLSVTNFQNESSCLYLSHDGLFRDRNVKFGLDRISSALLGFGTQAIDYDNNALVDLVVANGHVEDLSVAGQPFRQPLQVLANTATRFIVAANESPGDAFDQPRLGRSLVRCDLNRDGRSDFVVTDMLDKTSVWVNDVESGHHWIGLRLMGTRSERDAIGAHVSVELSGTTLHHWASSGDGYLGRNDAKLCIGLGDDSKIDKLIIDWPSGAKQVFAVPQTNIYCLLVEGDPVVYEESHFAKRSTISGP